MLGDHRWLSIVAHTIIVLALIAAYVIVTVDRQDGTAVLGVLGGYIGGAGAASILTVGQRRNGGTG